jgi:hypothetical protein
MTYDRDFDRLAKTWLELGPNEAPDRVVAAVLQAAETTPQARRPLLRSFRRIIPMNRLSIAAVAAVLIAVVGGGILLTRSGNDGVGGPVVTPAPSTPALSPSASQAVALPATMLGTWMGGTKPDLDLAEGAGSALIITPLSVAMTQSASADRPAMSVRVSLSESSTLHVETGSLDPAGCPADAVGDYPFQLSADGRTLTISSGTDPCAKRLSSMPGTYWKRGCKHTDDNCLGDIAAGTYQSQFIDPRLKPTESWLPVFGGVTYTVPEGWSNSDDWPDSLSLMTSDRYAEASPDGLPNGQLEDVTVVARPLPNKVTTACDSQPVTSVPTTVDGFIDWIVGQPSLQATAPHPITVDGRPAKYVDVNLAPGWTQGCANEPSSGPTSVFLTNASPTAQAWGIGAGEHLRVVIIDIGGGDIAMAWVDSTYEDSWPVFFQNGTEIIAGMQFK